VVNAVLLAHQLTPQKFQVYNVATGDYITVTEIARLAIEVMGLAEDQVRIEYSGGDRGWKGDVPIVRLNTDRIRGLGWVCRRTSRQALCAALNAMLPDLQLGRL
jgi:UDP-glucose 4-epimerase